VELNGAAILRPTSSLICVIPVALRTTRASLSPMTFSNSITWYGMESGGQRPAAAGLLPITARSIEPPRNAVLMLAPESNAVHLIVWSGNAFSNVFWSFTSSVLSAKFWKAIRTVFPPPPSDDEPPTPHAASTGTAASNDKAFLREMDMRALLGRGSGPATPR
jgi:hypothetical protein